MSEIYEKRHQNRLNAKLSVEAQIMIPEDTFQPKVYKGITENISESGMKVILFGFDKGIYVKMLRAPRYVKIKLEELVQEKETFLIGRVVWIDYHFKKDSNEEPLCKIGLFFESMTEEQTKKIQQLINILQS